MSRLLVANKQPTELSEPCVGWLDYPAALVSFEVSPAFVLPSLAALAIGNAEAEASSPEPSGRRFGVAGTVGDQPLRFSSWTAFSAGTLTSASVASPSATSPGEALSSRAPSGRPPPSTSTIHFVPLPRPFLQTAEPSFSPERIHRPGTPSPHFNRPS